MNRVLEVLESMQMIQLHALPEANESPWSIEMSCIKIDSVCRNAASELHKKSLMVEEAVEEIMTLVKKINLSSEERLEDDFMFEGQWKCIINK